MDGYSLIQEWPKFGKANAETLVMSPAWRMDLVYDGSRATLRKTVVSQPDSPLWLNIDVEGESHVVGICDSPVFPDMHALWARRDELPKEILLALIEKECGNFFQALENALKMQLSIKDICEECPSGHDRSLFFSLATENGGLIGFMLDMTPSLMLAFGKLRYIDVGHESIRSMTRKSWVEYALIDLADGDIERLEVGAHVIIPGDARASWKMSVPDDDLAHVIAADPCELSFAQIVDDDLPAITEPGKLVLAHRGNIIATGSMVRLGVQSAFKVEVLNNV